MFYQTIDNTFISSPRWGQLREGLDGFIYTNLNKRKAKEELSQVFDNFDCVFQTKFGKFNTYKIYPHSPFKIWDEAECVLGASEILLGHHDFCLFSGKIPLPEISNRRVRSDFTRLYLSVRPNFREEIVGNDLLFWRDHADTKRKVD